MKMNILVGVLLGLLFGSVVFADDSRPLTTVSTNDEGESLVADSIGKTLYVFDPDMNQATPKCVGDCAEQWPPYVLTAAEAAGLQSPLGSVARANNKIQLTYNGRPVYTFALDRIKGDDLGDGLGGVWHYIEIQ
jgi:predicted lipoprotein with Yx(FWY)xxD motif